MSTIRALGILLAIIVVIGGYLALTAALRIVDYWPGFVFLLQWSMMEGMKRERLPHAALGAAVGTAIASIPIWFAPILGPTAALALLTIVALGTTFIMIRGWLPLAVNAATMLFLTVVTIPHIAAGTTPASILLGLLAGAAYFGGLALVATLIGKARSKSAPADPKIAV